MSEPNRIQQLDEKTIGHISAGEVVERPAQVVKELLENSLDAGSTSIHVIIERGGFDKIQIEDNGTGISPEISDQLFEPYATTKEHGTGLGLSIVRQTIADHNGYTRFQNLDSGGVCFTIELPVK